MPIERWENEGGLVLGGADDGGQGAGGAIALRRPNEGGGVAVVDVNDDKTNALADGVEYTDERGCCTLNSTFLQEGREPCSS